VLFGGTDKDYRDTDVTNQQTTKTNSSNLDADSIFEINSKCLSLAEQKYKSKELSSEEYQATLKLLQNILESEVKRLTAHQTLVFLLYQFIKFLPSQMN
jgi:Cdc6-like AAA superfamily ATPase